MKQAHGLTQNYSVTLCVGAEEGSVRREGCFHGFLPLNRGLRVYVRLPEKAVSGGLTESVHLCGLLSF